MIRAYELKEILKSIDDEEMVVLRVRPSMCSLDDGTVTVNKVSYTEIVYNLPHPPQRNRNDQKTGSNPSTNGRR